MLSLSSLQGAAFGFSSIAAQAGEQLAPYLSKIVPKMYRYQFDPNPKIQQAMSSIWNALVTNTKETVSHGKHAAVTTFWLWREYDPSYSMD